MTTLRAGIQSHRGRPMLAINGRATMEAWCWCGVNAIPDFAAAGLRICQFPIEDLPWWVGPDQYDFGLIDDRIERFIEAVPGILLMPRVMFGFAGEGWRQRKYPEQLSVARCIDGRTADFASVGVKKVECWQSAGSQEWSRAAGDALTALVEHFENLRPDHILGYHIGGGVSSEWFRWWNFADEVYEDYSDAARDAFRRFLKERYVTDEALQVAWQRDDASFANAEVPAPVRIHTAGHGFLRDLATERDVVDWLECLSDLNATQLTSLCRRAKDASGGRKLVGCFYGYLWPHSNTQNPARSGHLALQRLLACEAIDYISSPYHYDNRLVGGVHHSQTVPQAIERAGKLHMDETDTPTPLIRPNGWPYNADGAPRTIREARDLLRRDAATVFGTAGNLWWMDLKQERWFAGAEFAAELRAMNSLARRSEEWTAEPQAQAALVIDDQSYAYSDLISNLNAYMSALPRQFEWSDLGFPFDTILLSEIGRVRPYKLYVFLNAWRLDQATRRDVRRAVRQAGVTAIWFYAAGYFDERRGGVEGVEDAVGMRLLMQRDAVIPEIAIQTAGHALLEQDRHTPRGASRFGARLDEDRIRRTLWDNPRGWDTPISPIFAVDDPRAAVLGCYAHDGSTGLACRDIDGGRSIYCGAPLLPGWLMRRIAAAAGVHLYTPLGCVVHHRGPLVSVYAPQGGAIRLCAPVGQTLSPIPSLDEADDGSPDRHDEPGEFVDHRFRPGETLFLQSGE